jgi:hypothetical protein
MNRQLANIGLTAIFGISIFAGIIGVANAEITTYNEIGKYIEGINVSVNTSSDFNRSYINELLIFQINNTRNATASTFSVTNQSGLTVNKTSLNATDWFHVNATAADTYWVNVSNSENQSEYVNFTVEYSSPPAPPPQDITIRIKPETLNLASKGVVTAFITLPAGYDIRDIKLDTVECENASAVRGMVSEEDTGTYIAKFNRQDLEDLEPGDAVVFTVTWELNDGTQFEGNDTIRVIRPGLLPDHPFYKVKRWTERVHKFFTFNDTAKARLHMRFSEARLAEAEAVIQLGKPEWAGGLMEDYMEELGETHQCMQRQSQKGKHVADLAEYVCNTTEEQAEILADLVDEVPEEEKPYMGRAINASSNGHIRALEAIKEEKPERAAQLSAGFAEKRMIRAKEMFEAGKPDQAQRMLRKYDESMEEAEKAMQVAENRGLNVSELAEHVGDMTYEHVEVLEELLEQAPEQDKPQIEDAIGVAIHRREAYVNKTQKDLQKTAEKNDRTGTGKIVKETRNSEKKRGPK